MRFLLCDRSQECYWLLVIGILFYEQQTTNNKVLQIVTPLLNQQIFPLYCS